MNLLKKTIATLGLVSLVGSAAAEVKQPLEVINRPLTAPASQAEVGLGFFLSFFKIADESDSSKGLGLTAAYGINDKIDARVSYATFLEDGVDFKGPLTLELGYSLMNTSPLHVAADVNVGYDTLFEAMTPLGLGARVRYNLNDKMAIFSGGNQLTITLDGGPELAPGVDAPKPIYLSLPVGFAYQVNPNLYVAAETNLANIEISDSETQFIFDSYIPVGLHGIYAVNEMIDAGVSFDIDLDNTDAFTLGVMARAFF
ncbi:MAG: outer membrane beta-barrel protein [Myxococcales bacterium]|nr:outer membrane beta-barrel protein [Myxococcales bacterium]